MSYLDLKTRALADLLNRRFGLGDDPSALDELQQAIDAVVAAAVREAVEQTIDRIKGAKP